MSVPGTNSFSESYVKAHYQLKVARCLFGTIPMVVPHLNSGSNQLYPPLRIQVRPKWLHRANPVGTGMDSWGPINISWSSIPDGLSMNCWTSYLPYSQPQSDIRVEQFHQKNNINNNTFPTSQGGQSCTSSPKNCATQRIPSYFQKKQHTPINFFKKCFFNWNSMGPTYHKGVPCPWWSLKIPLKFCKFFNSLGSMGLVYLPTFGWFLW